MTGEQMDCAEEEWLGDATESGRVCRGEIVGRRLDKPC